MREDRDDPTIPRRQPYMGGPPGYGAMPPPAFGGMMQQGMGAQVGAGAGAGTAGPGSRTLSFAPRSLVLTWVWLPRFGLRGPGGDCRQKALREWDWEALAVGGSAVQQHRARLPFRVPLP